MDKDMMRLLFLLLLPGLGLLLSCRKDDTEARQLETDIKQIEAWLDGRGLQAVRTASGLHYVVHHPGEGTSFPGPDSRVAVHYKGTYLDGQIFDQSPSGQAAVFFLNQVIAGWREGIRYFRKGGRGLLLLPSRLAYGPHPPHPSIPPNAVMIFEVELADFDF